MHLRFSALALLGLVVATAGSVSRATAQAQPPAAQPSAQEGVSDEISRQASALEAELGKYKDNSSEAAEAMSKLIELYHREGRVYGLVRVGQMFATAQAGDPRHQAHLLKLIDGLQALSRNKELSATIRQFLARYPTAPQGNELAVRLADALLQLEDRKASAEACAEVWKRLGPSELGKQYGVRAIREFSAINNGEAIARSATLAEEIFDKLPAGEYARELGLHAFTEWRRTSQWAKSSAVGQKLLQKNLAGDAEQRRQLLLWLAENHGNLGQHANAAEAYRQARALKDDQFVHYNLIYRLYHAQAKPDQLAGPVNEYVQKFPARPDRSQMQSYLALAYIANGAKPQGVAILATLLSEDPVFNSNAAIFVRENGSEPAQLADSEKKLLAALAKNPPGAYYLRYVLAFDLYRDRVKDLAKAKAMARELLKQSPTEDGHTSAIVEWLLNSAADINEFRGDLALVLATRAQNPHLVNMREWLRGWNQSARNNKEWKDRVALAQDEIKKSDADPLIATFAEQRGLWNANGEAARARLLVPATFAKLNDAAARAALSAQADYFRHYAAASRRGDQVKVYAQWRERFPQDPQVAYWYLETASDYGKPEDCKPAATHYLTLTHPSSNADIWRRLLVCADKAVDPALVKTIHAWIVAAEQKFGPDPTYASSIGDLLAKHKLEAEGLAWWKKYVVFNRRHYESRECASRVIAKMTDPKEKTAALQSLLPHDTDFHGRYAMLLAGDALQAGDLPTFTRLLAESRKRQIERPLAGWDFDIWTVASWFDGVRANTMLKDDQKAQVYTAIRDLELYPASAGAALALLEPQPVPPGGAMQRLLEFQKYTRLVGNEWYDWDRLLPFAQGAAGKKDFLVSATLATGMLANIPNVDEPRKKVIRDLATQSLARLGAVGLTIDESSPLAPLLQAALYFRLGDERLAFDAFLANKKLFDENRNQLPPDLLMFVCERLIAGGGDQNHEEAETILRGWLVAFSESMQIEDSVKARMQLLLARNFFKAQRFDVARSEFTTVVNRYPNSPQAIEAEFGVGETYLAQKVYDQAEQVFEKLARSVEIDVVVRAEFLRGVLSFRRGDRDEAREIFRAVLERVPSVELANQALFNLAEVYGAEERYIDQLNLLRTVGRLGRASKRRHVPGTPLSIVVHDSDLGISRGHNRIPVRVITEPGGDEELVYLVGSGAGKGLFRADVETRLGQAAKNDRVLQLTGQDVIRCDYPEEFKAEFKRVPLSDVEIRVASDAKFQLASSVIIDQQEETFSQTLARQSAEEEGDQRRSQVRPANQIKPGNPIYLRVQDGDRDLTNEVDEIVVKLTAESGDQVQVKLKETGPHTGIFEAVAASGELPAGALASDTAIDHSPLMAIDQDPKTFWMSQPDGAAPKTLSIDMKDLKEVNRVKFSSPAGDSRQAIRGELFGSQDGEFWFRIYSHPERPAPAPLAAEYGPMVRRVYNGDFTSYTTWDQVAALSKNAKPIEEGPAEQLTWKRPEDSENPAARFGVLFQGLFVQPRDGAVRFQVQGNKTGLVIDGKPELPIGPGNRTVDVWLSAGAHQLAIFACSANGAQPVEAQLVRSSLEQSQIVLTPFRAADFDLKHPAAAKAPPVVTAESAPPAIPLLLSAAKLEKKSEKFAVLKENNIDVVGFWQAPEDTLSWEFQAPSAGVYEVWCQYAHAGPGGSFKIESSGTSAEAIVPDTGAWTTFRTERVARILLDKAGAQTLTLKPVEIKGDGLMALRTIELRPAVGASMLSTARDWEFHFPQQELRHVRLVCQEYLGDAWAVGNVEIAGGQPGVVHIPTKEDVLTLAANQTLEIAAGDQVVGAYTDDVTLNEQGGSNLLSARLQATYFNANIQAIAYDFERNQAGQVFNVRKVLRRIDPGERIVVEIVDFDEDRTQERDVIKFQAVVNDGQPLELEATETEENSGTFTKEIDTAAMAAEGKLVVKAGDRVYLRYYDDHNTFPGHSTPREAAVYVIEPTIAQVRILETRVIPPPADSKAPPQVIVTPSAPGKEISGVAFEAPLTIEVIDPDAAKDSRSTASVLLTTSDGATVEVLCAISTQLSPLPRTANDDWALEDGRFVGQVILQLGGKNSPAVVPITPSMPRGLVGKVVLGEEGAQPTETNLITRVLNLTGKDIVSAAYNDARHPAGPAKSITAQGRLISNGSLACTDRDYDKPIEQLHVGEKLYLKVVDPDLDASDARDTAAVEITTDLGEKEIIRLEETLAHSGEFTGSLQLRAIDKPTPENFDPADPVLETYFGDTVRLRYLDKAASTESGELEIAFSLPVVVGTDGLIAAFSKTFNDENLAVETKFRIAESFFELFKSHKTLGREDEKKVDLEAGRRILREVMEDYPDPKYAPRVAYLLGQFAQELEQWDEAIRAYDMILRQFPDNTLAPDAQYKLAQCYEEAGDFDQALEAYVTLAATHPKSPLIPNVMIRISDYFYKKESFEIAAQVGEKFLERFQGHQHAPRMAFRVGQCYFKSKLYKKAGESFDMFAKIFPDDALCADSLFWAGEAFRMGGSNREAFIRYNNCRWKHQESEAAKYARGRLALPEMLQQFEAEANSVDE